MADVGGWVKGGGRGGEGGGVLEGGAEGAGAGRNLGGSADVKVKVQGTNNTAVQQDEGHVVGGVSMPEFASSAMECCSLMER